MTRTVTILVFTGYHQVQFVLYFFLLFQCVYVFAKMWLIMGLWTQTHNADEYIINHINIFRLFLLTSYILFHFFSYIPIGSALWIICLPNICLCKKFHCGNFTFINFGKNSCSRILHIIDKYVSFHVLALKQTRFATWAVCVRHAVYRTALRHTSFCLPHSMSFLLTCSTDKLITNP